MISLEEIKKKIPEHALNKFKEIFSDSIYEKIVLSIRVKRISSFRVNSLKSNKKEIIDYFINKSIKIKDIPYIPYGFQLFENLDNRLIKFDIVNDGKIYLQSISSMIPVVVLNPGKNEIILDIAAAPGSKTTQIAQYMENSGIIDAIEPDFIRFERLKHNIKLLGVNNVNLYNMSAIDFCINKINYYDKVLVDAPCSGDGRFNIYDKNSYINWKPNLSEKLSKLQYKLLESAIKVCKINGIIVYSTCSINPFENEEVIDKILNNYGKFIQIEKIDSKFFELPESINPILQYKNFKYNSNINKCLKLIPSQNLEGFFICKIRKVIPDRK